MRDANGSESGGKGREGDMVGGKCTETLSSFSLELEDIRNF